jgi:hypothetical protein
VLLQLCGELVCLVDLLPYERSGVDGVDKGGHQGLGWGSWWVGELFGAMGAGGLCVATD